MRSDLGRCEIQRKSGEKLEVARKMENFNILDYAASIKYLKITIKTIYDKSFDANYANYVLVESV